MTDYTYSRVAALDFTTTPVTVGRSATGSVYAIGDTTYTTPLNVTAVVGGATSTTVSSDANGFFPDFTVANRTSVVFKQAGTSFTSVLTTTDPVPGAKGDPGPQGAPGLNGANGANSSLVEDLNNPGLYFVVEGQQLTQDPGNTGFYLVSGV